MRPAHVVTRFISLHPGAQKCDGPFGGRCPDRATGKTSLPTLNEQRNLSFQPKDAGKTNRFKPFHFLFVPRKVRSSVKKPSEKIVADRQFLKEETGLAVRGRIKTSQKALATTDSVTRHHQAKAHAEAVGRALLLMQHPKHPRRAGCSVKRVLSPSG